jgi:hypothetical protein
MLSVSLQFFLVALIVNINRTFGCSCRPEYPLRSSYTDAKNIFIGKVLQVQMYKNWNRREIQFDIETKFKGIFPASNKINVSTPLQEDSCGLPIQVGEKWQVWANFEDYSFFPNEESTNSVDKAFLSTTRCHLTTRELYRNIEFLLQQSTTSPISG